jgi:hypothetical protein
VFDPVWSSMTVCFSFWGVFGVLGNALGDTLGDVLGDVLGDFFSNFFGDTGFLGVVTFFGELFSGISEIFSCAKASSSNFLRSFVGS